MEFLIPELPIAELGGSVFHDWKYTVEIWLDANNMMHAVMPNLLSVTLANAWREVATERGFRLLDYMTTREYVRRITDETLGVEFPIGIALDEIPLKYLPELTRQGVFLVWADEDEEKWSYIIEGDENDATDR